MTKDNSKRLVEQEIYSHGGSRIWVEHSDGERELIADTYQSEEFAMAVKKLADEWYLPKSDDNKKVIGQSINQKEGSCLLNHGVTISTPGHMSTG